MSIRLEVKKYCQDCPHFDPDTSKIQAYNPWSKPEITETIVFCRNNGTCEKILGYLKETMLTDKNKETKRG